MTQNVHLQNLHDFTVQIRNANGGEWKKKQSAERALQMSNAMGYHWGKVDAGEVLKAIRE